MKKWLTFQVILESRVQLSWNIIESINSFLGILEIKFSADL
jgi:hypothetical protein